MNVPASGLQKDVQVLPKELDVKVAKMHLSALDAERNVLSVEVLKLAPQERVQKRTVEQVVNVSVEMQSQVFLFQEVQGTMEVPQGQYIDRIVDVSVCCNTKYDPSEQCTSRQHIRQWTASEFNVPEGRSRSTKCGSSTDFLRYLL